MKRKVWLITKHVYYEGFNIIDVFLSEKEARKQMAIYAEALGWDGNPDVIPRPEYEREEEFVSNFNFYPGDELRLTDYSISKLRKPKAAR